VLIGTVFSPAGAVGRARVPLTPVYQYAQAQFPSRNVGFVLALKHNRPYLLRTVDDGKVWVSHRFFFTTWFQFVNAQDGWVDRTDPLCNLCDSHLLRTTNGGKSWRTLRELGNWRGPGWVQFVTPTHGFVHYRPCGTCAGEMISTDDGGLTWHRAVWPFAAPYWQYHFTSATTGYVVEGVTARTSRQAARSSGGPRAIPQCRNKLYYTTDGGAHWSIRDRRELCYTIPSFANRQDGWMVLDPTTGTCSMGGCLVKQFRTTDGGRTWKVEPTEPSATGCPGSSGCKTWMGLGCCGGFAALTAFPSVSHGWVDISAGAGPEDGGIAVTSDGGRRWFRYLNHYRLPSLAVTGPSEAWAASGSEAGSPTALLHTTDDGGMWTTVDPRF